MTSIENVGGNDACYGFDYPPEVLAKTGLSGLMYPRKALFQMIARDQEKTDPVLAAFYREVASYFPDAGHDTHSVNRDGNRNILVDYDDWDELSDEQRLFRANRNAAIAILDRLRFHLEMMDDNIDLKEEVDDLRQGIAELVEDIAW